MSAVTVAPTLLVEDPSSLKNLDHLVGLARSMMDHMLHSPVALERFTKTAFFGVSTRFLDGDKGVSNTFDFSQHQAHPFSLSLVSQYEGGQEWTAKLHKSNLLGKSLGDRTYDKDSAEWKNGKAQTPVDGPWEVRVKDFDASMLQTLSKYLQQVTNWSKDLSDALSSPAFLQAAKIEKNARNGLRFVDNLPDDLPAPDLARFRAV